MGRQRQICMAAAAAWTTAIAGVFAGMGGEWRETTLAAAVTLTVVGAVRGSARDETTVLRLGLWAGAGQRCAQMRDSDAPEREQRVAGRRSARRSVD